MKGQVTKIVQMITKNGYGYMVTFTLEDGKSGRAWIITKFANFERWKPIIGRGVGVVVDGLNYKSKSLINADSMVKIIRDFPKKDFKNEERCGIL